MATSKTSGSTGGSGKNTGADRGATAKTTAERTANAGAQDGRAGQGAQGGGAAAKKSGGERKMGSAAATGSAGDGAANVQPRGAAAKKSGGGGAAKKTGGAAAKKSGGAAAKKTGGAGGGGARGDDRRRQMREFCESRLGGWSHDEWEGLIGGLQQSGHDVSDRDAVGMELERERLAMVLEKVPGVNAQKSKALVSRYQRLFDLRQASADEIAASGKLPRPLAERISEAIR